jgi:hypothetical protein
MKERDWDIVKTTFDKGINHTSTSLKSDWNSIYVVGQWVSSGNRLTIKDKNPYTGDIIREMWMHYCL